VLANRSVNIKGLTPLPLHTHTLAHTHTHTKLDQQLRTMRKKRFATVTKTRLPWNCLVDRTNEWLLCVRDQCF